MKNKIPICKDQYVMASDLFKDLGGLKKSEDDLWDTFSLSEPEFQWGGNSVTLITARMMLDHIVHCEDNKHSQYKELLRRCEALPEGLNCYINLED